VRSTYLKILGLAAPVILANLSVPLLGAVDTAILGHLDNAIHLGAVAVGSQLITLVLWIFGFLRMGTTSLASRFYGAGDNLALHLLILRSLGLGVIFGFGAIAVSPWMIPWTIDIIAGDSLVSQDALAYANIRIWSAPATLCSYAIAGWFIGRQNTAVIAILLVAMNSLNIFLDFIFIITWGLESRGAAYASLISEYVGFVIAFGFLLKTQFREHWAPKWTVLLEPTAIKSLISINAQIMVRTFALVMTTTFFVAMSSRQGEATLAANAILISLLYLTAYGLDGVANATEAMVGKAFGKGDSEDLRQILKGSMHVAFGFALMSSLTILFGQTQIIQLYTSLAEVSELAVKYIPWMVALPLLSFWGFQYDGIFIGMGMGHEMMMSMLFAVVFIFFPVWWGTQALGNHGLWLAMCSWYLGRSLSQWYLLTQKMNEQGFTNESDPIVVNE
jgi:multidrug resistance protein, MATE family